MVKKKSSKEQKEHNGAIGIVNLGNSCYLNSILQCLFHIPELISYINSDKYEEDLLNNQKINNELMLTKNEKQRQELYYKLINEFKNLINQLWNSNLTSLEPKIFKKILSELFPEFSGNTQQDAHEVLTNILDSFHLALNKSLNEGGLLICSSLSDKSLLLHKTNSFIADASHKAVNDSFIEDTFFGQLSTIFSCSKCHLKLSEIYEPFSSMELSIPYETDIWVYILPLKTDIYNQLKVNLHISENLSFNDIYNNIKKIYGYDFSNYIFFWPKYNNKYNSSYLRHNKKRRNNLYENNSLFDVSDNSNNEEKKEMIIINENNNEKCCNFIMNAGNLLFLMENIDNNEILNNSKEKHCYEYFIKMKLVDDNNVNSNKYNFEENIPRVFKVNLLKKHDTDNNHAIFSQIYKYINTFSKNNNNNYINKDKKIKKNPKKIEKNKNHHKAELTIELNENSKENANNNTIISNKDNHNKNYYLGVICDYSYKNNNKEYTCPICNKKIKHSLNDTAQHNNKIECFCINDYFDSKLIIKNKEKNKLLTSKLIEFIDKYSGFDIPSLNIIIHISKQYFSYKDYNEFWLANNEKKAKDVTDENLTLFKLFENFAAEEKIDNICKCKNCGDIKSTYQKKDIHKFPQILIIHIKRFKSEIEKNEESIEFPEEIDLSKFNNKGNKGKYSLNSVVFHHGTLISGHYTAICKYSPTGQWMFCNDKKIKMFPIDKNPGNFSNDKNVIKPLGDGYILFYRKYE